MNIYNSLIGILFIIIVIVSVCIRFKSIENKFKYDISMQNQEKQIAVIKSVTTSIIVIAIIRIVYTGIIFLFT